MPLRPHIVDYHHDSLFVLLQVQVMNECWGLFTWSTVSGQEGLAMIIKSRVDFVFTNGISAVL